MAGRKFRNRQWAPRTAARAGKPLARLPLVFYRDFRLHPDPEADAADLRPTPGSSFLVALTLLTVVPIRSRALPDDATVAGARRWFPAVGLLLGALLAGLTFAAGHVPPLIGAVLILGAWVGITGALHLDGFCDLCDGLFGGRTPADRLRILKDPHVGTFGLVGGVLLQLAKFAALAVLLAPEQRDRAPWLVGLAALTARCFILTMAAGARYPRAGGTGKVIVEATSRGEALLVALLALGATLAVSGALVVAALVPLAAVLLLRRLCVARLAGITGDCLGAAVELTEALFLLTAAALPG